MKRLREFDQYRRTDWEIRSFGRVGDDNGGCFVIPFNGSNLQCVAAAGGNWDHVSVSVADRCPSWEEMSHVFALFAKPSETWMQLHVPAREHINYHPFCLHLWRPHNSRGIPLPPSHFVGPK